MPEMTVGIPELHGTEQRERRCSVGAAASLPLDAVLEYKDKPGDRTSPHHHPDSLRYTLSSFERRLIDGARETDIELEAGRSCLAASEHAGENIGTTDTYVLFVELKEPPSRDNS